MPNQPVATPDPVAVATAIHQVITAWYAINLVAVDDRHPRPWELYLVTGGDILMCVLHHRTLRYPRNIGDRALINLEASLSTISPHLRVVWDHSKPASTRSLNQTNA